MLITLLSSCRVLSRPIYCHGFVEMNYPAGVGFYGNNEIDDLTMPILLIGHMGSSSPAQLHI